MKKLSISAIVIAASMLFFTSCQKENSFSKEEETTIEQNAFAPERDNSVDTQNPEEKPDFMTKTQAQSDNLLQPMENREGILQTRSNDPVIVAYPCLLPDFNSNTISCGTRLSSSTIGRPNRYSDSHFYSRLGFQSNLNGGDRVFYMNVTAERIAHFYISNTTKNLAMLLLKGHYVWNNGRIEERFDQIEAYTQNNSTTSDRLINNHLTPGRYMLVVDSKPLGESNFDLYVACSPINTSCNSTPGISVYQDKFDSYNVGKISPQSSNWFRTNVNARFDGEIIANGAGKILKVDYKEGYGWSDQANFNLDLGPRTIGNYQLEFNMWLYGNNTASMNMLKIIGVETGASIYINKNGQGYVYLNAAPYKAFTFPNNKWAKVRFDINLSSNLISFYVDGVFKASWTCRASINTNSSNTRLFRGMNFNATRDGLFYINNLCFIKRF